jgi:hypothetical protein
MKELNNFFGLKWKINRPKIFLLKDRKTINALLSQKTKNWITGWVDKKDVFVLDKDSYEKESCHKYSDEKYHSVIKHELGHLFFQIISDFNRKPDWLWEGVATYLAGQNKIENKPKKFHNFLKYYNKNGSGVYYESGFAINFLVENYGKQKLLKLIKSLKNINSRKNFANKFEDIYGFRLEYKNFK